MFSVEVVVGLFLNKLPHFYFEEKATVNTTTSCTLNIKDTLKSFLVDKQRFCLHSLFLSKTHGVLYTPDT